MLTDSKMYLPGYEVTGLPLGEVPARGWELDAGQDKVFRYLNRQGFTLTPTKTFNDYASPIIGEYIVSKDGFARLLVLPLFKYKEHLLDYIIQWRGEFKEKAEKIPPKIQK